jgi:hypothetical protein
MFITTGGFMNLLIEKLIVNDTKFEKIFALTGGVFQVQAFGY